MPNKEETPGVSPKFDFSAFPADTLFYERRDGRDRRADLAAAEAAEAAKAEAPAVPEPTQERRARKQRRRRIDPTTFEKQYTDDELEFMNAMQKFKVQTGKAFPSHGEVLRIARGLGYRKVDDYDGFEDAEDDDHYDLGAGANGLS